MASCFGSGGQTAADNSQGRSIEFAGAAPASTRGRASELRSYWPYSVKTAGFEIPAAVALMVMVSLGTSGSV